MSLPTAYLFVPGNRPERFAKALAAGADAVIIDLEDAVSAEHKEAARAALRDWARARPQSPVPLLVRVNDAATPWFAGDLALARECGIAGIVLPKTEDAAALRAMRAGARDGEYVVALIESALGVQNVAAIAAAPGVQRLAFGTLDYAMDLALSGDERGLAYPSAQMAIASRAAGIAQPVAGVTTELEDAAKIAADVAVARAYGFGAKLCIHPKQLAPVRRAFAPSAAEVAWAERVVAAAAAGPGAVQVDGRMVDRPVIVRAQAILERARG